MWCRRLYRRCLTENGSPNRYRIYSGCLEEDRSPAVEAAVRSAEGPVAAEENLDRTLTGQRRMVNILVETKTV